jgi:pyruvate dehydrogenase (quinone)/pyruvate decarboxylase
MVLRVLSDLMADDAAISLDCGANTHFAARMIRLRERQTLTGTGMLVSMAPGAAPAETAEMLRAECDDVVCLATPRDFMTVSI